MISNKSYKYVKDNFDIEINVKKFINLIDNSNLFYENLDKRYFGMNIFHKLIGAKRYYND